jgi:hypothetical protein
MLKFLLISSNPLQELQFFTITHRVFKKLSDNRCYRKVSTLGQKRNAGLTYSISAAISFKIDSLGTYTVIPSFFPHFKGTVEVIFLNGVEYHLQFPFGCQTLFQNIVPSVSFSIWETK